MYFEVNEFSNVILFVSSDTDGAGRLERSACILPINHSSVSKYVVFLRQASLKPSMNAIVCYRIS